jgi:hypothetical protein
LPLRTNKSLLQCGNCKFLRAINFVRTSYTWLFLINFMHLINERNMEHIKLVVHILKCFLRCVFWDIWSKYLVVTKHYKCNNETHTHTRAHTHARTEMQYLNKQERYKMAAQNTVNGNCVNVESTGQLKARKYMEIRSPKLPSSHLWLYSPLHFETLEGIQ